MTVLVGDRLRLFTLADERGSVSQACRMVGVHRSPDYPPEAPGRRGGLEALNVREHRRPRMLTEIGPHLELRIIAFSLAHPGLGPQHLGRAETPHEAVVHDERPFPESRVGLAQSPLGKLSGSSNTVLSC
jgi:hypothetical protein